MSAAILPFTGRASHGLTEIELAEVQANLTEVVASLRQKRALDPVARGYLDAIIAELIDIVDELDGDPDEEVSLCGITFSAFQEIPGPFDCEIECEDEGAQCDDEGAWDDREPEEEW